MGQCCEAFGVSLGGAASSADLGCSSEYSTADLSDGSLKAEVGKVFMSTAIGHESLGTEPNVKPQRWKGKMVVTRFAVVIIPSVWATEKQA